MSRRTCNKNKISLLTVKIIPREKIVQVCNEILKQNIFSSNVKKL